MSEVQADLDGIRMLGDLLHRQSQHVAAMVDYLHDTGNVVGAFDGVLALFQGSYADAFGHASEGLQISRDANQMLADRCAKTADNYERADKENYLAFARLAGQHQMTIGPYRPAGSGLDTVPPGGPYQPAVDPGGGSGFLAQIGEYIDTGSGKATEFLEPVTSAVDTVLDPYQEYGKDAVEAVHGAVAEDTVLWKGKPVIEERLDTMHKRLDGKDGTRFLPDDRPDGFETWHATQDDRLKQAEGVLDPTAKLRKTLVESAGEKLGLGDHKAGNAETQHRINKGMEWTSNAMDTYDTVKSVAEDPTLGVRGLAKDGKEMVDTYGDVLHYADISNDRVDTSVRDELRESR